MKESICRATDLPYLLNAQKGKTYAWCSCGKSSKQPLCDGSHTGSSKRPVLFKSDTNKQLVLCGCKASKTPPYCDSTHLTLGPSLN